MYLNYEFTVHLLHSTPFSSPPCNRIPCYPLPNGVPLPLPMQVVETGHHHNHEVAKLQPSTSPPPPILVAYPS